MRTPLVYALHSGNLYGTERMALSTIERLTDEFEPLMFAPPGPALAAAAQCGYATFPFNSPLEFAAKLRKVLAANKRLAFVATGVAHSLACIVLNGIYRRKISHIHVVHGGADEQLSYGRKRRLNKTDVTFVAVSPYVQTRLIANGVCGDRITVIENFLTDAQVRNSVKREAFSTNGVRNLIVISRIDPIKRVDLLLDALDLEPALQNLPIRIFGTGWDFETLCNRASQRNANVTFEGFSDEIPLKLAESDLLIHLCPEEPFGLSLIEAMAAGVPVLVPNSGGAAIVVDHDRSGFHFEANRADALAARLQELTTIGADTLNRVVAGGRAALASRFSATLRTEDYRRLLTA